MAFSLPPEEIKLKKSQKCSFSGAALYPALSSGSSPAPVRAIDVSTREPGEASMRCSRDHSQGLDSSEEASRYALQDIHPFLTDF